MPPRLILLSCMHFAWVVKKRTTQHAATTPPGSRSTPTAPRPPPLLPLLMRPTPGRRRSSSARRARSRTSCDPSTPVSSLLNFFFFCPFQPSVPECFLAQSGFWLLHAVKASILTGFQVTIPGQFSCLVLQFWIILLFLFRIVTLE